MFAPIIRGDENGPLHHHHVDKENSSSRTLGQAGGAKSVLQPQGGSVRKALGNITNTGTKQAGGSQGFGAADKASSKPAPGSAQPRRAFGVDITNSASALKQQQAPPSEPSVKRKPFQPLETQQQAVQQQPQPSLRPQQQQRSKAEVFAEDGIERMAGKGFREQEADRLMREEREIEERVRQLTSAMSMWKPQAVSNSSDCGEEDLSGLSLTPTKLRPLSGPRHAAESQSPEEVPLLLPDTPTAGPSHLEGSNFTGLPPQRVPLLTILPDPELDLDFDELA